MDELVQMHGFINDLWKLIKTTYTQDTTEDYWRRLSDEAVATAEKYGNADLAKRLLNAYLDYQEGRRSS